MKKTHFITVLFFGLFLSTSFCEETKFNELKIKAEEYEKNNQLVHALGTYWDAMVEEPLLGADLVNHFVKLQDAISEGNPGLGKYDDFEMFDNWVTLCEDFEIYWSEHPDDMFTLDVGTPKKGKVDMEARTAEYTVSVTQTRSQKFKEINKAVIKGYYKALSNHQQSWEKNLPNAWPMQTILKDSSKVNLVNYLTVNFPNKELTTTSFRLNEIGQIFYVNSNSEITLNQWVDLTDKKNTATCAACFSALTNLEFPENGNPKYSVRTNTEAKIKLIGEDEHVIATMNAPIRLMFDDYTGMRSTVFILFKNVKASDMKLLDNGQYKYVIESYTLQPRNITVTYDINNRGVRVFTGTKSKIVGSPINLLAKNKYAITDAIRVCNDAAYNRKIYLNLVSKYEKISKDFSCMQMKGSDISTEFFSNPTLTDERIINAEAELKKISGLDYKYNASTKCFERPFKEDEKEKAAKKKR